MCMSVHCKYAWCLRKSGEGIRCPGTGFTDSCELPCGCLESNPGPLGGQLVLLTAGPSLWLPGIFLAM
jgi:E3 ubiquitin-protein ligase NEDD4